MNERKQKIFKYLFADAPDKLEKKKVLNEIEGKFPTDEKPFDIVPDLQRIFEQADTLPPFDHFIKEYDYTFSLDDDIETPNLAEVLDIIHIEFLNYVQNDFAGELLDYIHDGEITDLEEFMRDVRSIIDEYDQTAGEEDQKTAHDYYQELKNTDPGIHSHIDPIDSNVDAFEYGSMSTIAGWTGHMKSTLARHIFYENITNGYNGIFISLEMPRRAKLFHMIARHSMHEKFMEDIDPVTANEIKDANFDDLTEEYIFDYVEDDLQNNDSYGEYSILEQEAFPSFTLSGIQSTIAKQGFEVDFIILDYVQLLKYEQHPFGVNHSDPVNYYVRQFSKLQHDVDGLGTSSHIMLLSQVNRSGYTRALERNGRYDNRAISEAHNIERNSSQVFFTFAPDELKEGNEAKVHLTKNRSGDTMADPTLIPVDPAVSKVGETLDLEEEKDDMDINVGDLV
jgi:replicative DNA helicase